VLETDGKISFFQHQEASTSSDDSSGAADKPRASE
jgi:hypothetical protein